MGRTGVWSYTKNIFARFLPMSTWILLCVGIFTNTFINFKTQPQYYYLRTILGKWLCVSRGTAPVITMCSLLVLIPVCRSLHTIMNRVLAGLSTRILASWLSRIKYMHTVCAITLIGFSLVHTGAHIMNAINFSRHYSDLYPEINVAKYKGENPAILICTWTGCSGIIMLLLLLLMAITSTSNFRKKHFNSFYITHHSFIIYLVLLLTHPLRGVLKEQYNIDKHIPGCVFQKNKTLNEFEDNYFKEYREYCEDPPQFKCISTKNWILVSLAIIIYITELISRKYTNNKVQAIQLSVLPGRAVHLRLKPPKPTFKILPGQYILLQCNQISNIEWHPFTVTRVSSLDNESFDLLISVRGDWTKSLHQMACNESFSFNSNTNYILRTEHQPIEFTIDGPFTSPMQAIVNTKYVICIAAGVGITAFVATIRTLLTECKTTKRMHLIWLVREPQEVFWYSKLLSDVLKYLWLQNNPDKFSFKIHITKDITKNETLDSFNDSIIKSRIHFGRPNWKEEFRIWRQMYKKEKISIFCCGPNKLTGKLRKYCYKSNRKGNSFTLIHEGF